MRLPRQQVLCDRGRYIGEYLSDLPGRDHLDRRQRRAGRLRFTSVCSWLHRTRRRDVFRLCSGKVQDIHWLGGVHGLRCRPVLGGDGRDGNRHLSELPRQLTVYDGQRRGD